MKNTLSYLAFTLLYISISCDSEFNAEPNASQREVFNTFWEGVDKYYPEFATIRVNWDCVRIASLSGISDTTSDEELMDFMKNALALLEDRHSALYPIGYPRYAFNRIDSVNWIGFESVADRYLEPIKGNESIKYGKIQGRDIGYIRIPGFHFSDESYQMIDQAINQFFDLKGIILDVRHNEGGALRNAEAVASRFIDGDYLYKFNRLRNGTDHDQLTDYIPYHVQKFKGRRFTKPVFVLTNSETFSAAEELVLMLKQSPNVTQVGDETQGGSGTTPIGIELPNGWAFRVSSIQLLNTTKNPIRGGIPPDVRVDIPSSQIRAGRDVILESAINLAD